MSTEEDMLQAFIEQQKAWEFYAAASNKYHQLADLLTVEQMGKFQQLAHAWVNRTYSK